MIDGLENLTPDDAAEVTRLLKLAARSSATMTGPELRQAREAAGLSIGQAVKLFNCRFVSLEIIESVGGKNLSLPWIEKLDRVYGLNCGEVR